MKWWGWVLIGLVVGASCSWLISTNRDAAAIEADARRRASAIVGDSVAKMKQQMADSVKATALAEAARVVASLQAHDSLVAALERTVGVLSWRSKEISAALATAQTAADSVPLLVETIRRKDELVAGQGKVITALREDVQGFVSATEGLKRAVFAADSASLEWQNSATRWKGVADSALALVGRPERKKWLGLIPAPTLEYGPLVCVGCGGKPVTYGGGAMLVFRR